METTYDALVRSQLVPDEHIYSILMSAFLKLEKFDKVIEMFHKVLGTFLSTADGEEKFLYLQHGNQCLFQKGGDGENAENLSRCEGVSRAQHCRLYHCDQALGESWKS